MKKRITLLLLSALLLSTATACNQTPENNEESFVESSAEESSVEESTEDSENPASDFEYEENADGGITIKRYRGEDKTVVVPKEIDGKPVTELSMAFSLNQNIISVDLPDSIIKIGGGAFMSCSSLKSVVLPKNLTEIANGAFEGCSSLSEIEFPTSLTRIGTRAFADCTALKNITLPANTSCGAEAFCNSGLEVLQLEDGIEYIAASAFAGTKIKEIVLPSSIKIIHMGAFGNCSALESVTLNEGLTTIEGLAFAACKNLTEIVIPESVTEMTEYVFKGSNALQRVKFEGDAPQNYRFEDDNGFKKIPYTIYYHQDAEGFSSPEWCGYHTEIW